jgi:hypothetical protein
VLLLPLLLPLSLLLLLLLSLVPAGTLPTSWAKLGPSLRELSLWDNDLAGTLPESWGDMVVLEKLDLSYNGLEG